MLTPNLPRNKGNPHWKRLRAVQTLFQLDLLQEKGMRVMDEILTDQDQGVKQQAQDVVQQVYSIKDEETLLACIFKILKVPERQGTTVLCEICPYSIPLPMLAVKSMRICKQRIQQLDKTKKIWG